MKKSQAVDRLVSEFKADGKWRKFFEDELDRMHGDGNIVTEEQYRHYLDYFNHLT